MEEQPYQAFRKSKDKGCVRKRKEKVDTARNDTRTFDNEHMIIEILRLIEGGGYAHSLVVIGKQPDGAS